MIRIKDFEQIRVLLTEIENLDATIASCALTVGGPSGYGVRDQKYGAFSGTPLNEARAKAFHAFKEVIKDYRKDVIAALRHLDVEVEDGI